MYVCVYIYTNTIKHTHTHTQTQCLFGNMLPLQSTDYLTSMSVPVKKRNFFSSSYWSNNSKDPYKQHRLCSLFLFA